MTSWHDHPWFLQAFAEGVQDVYNRLSAEERTRLSVVFTARSLPQRILAEGDPIPRRSSAPLREWPSS